MDRCQSRYSWSEAHRKSCENRSVGSTGLGTVAGAGVGFLLGYWVGGLLLGPETAGLSLIPAVCATGGLLLGGTLGGYGGQAAYPAELEPGVYINPDNPNSLKDWSSIDNFYKDGDALVVEGKDENGNKRMERVWKDEGLTIDAWDRFKDTYLNRDAGRQMLDNFRQAEGYYFDPLLLDLDGVETTSLSTYFDHDAQRAA